VVAYVVRARIGWRVVIRAVRDRALRDVVVLLLVLEMLTNYVFCYFICPKFILLCALSWIRLQDGDSCMPKIQICLLFPDAN
jgi:hypothetical protein